MVRGPAILAVAVPAGGAAVSHPFFHDRRSRGRSHAGDSAFHEHRFPRDLARALAGRDGPCLSDAARHQRNQELRGNGDQAGRGNRRALRHPAIYQTVLLSFAGQARGVVTKGIDPERERKSDEALQRIIAGKLDFSPDADGIEALLIGKQLAQEWKISPGDYVTLTSPQGRLTPYGLMPRTRRFRVTGVFDSGFYDY